mmetsp:Transcript_19234/g.38615  ORF Transcript_19234/g.38615 Transcript_19234/m.38615 type:complete len:90 (+) Transcript_19234:428-697(+)
MRFLHAANKATNTEMTIYASFRTATLRRIAPIHAIQTSAPVSTNMGMAMNAQRNFTLSAPMQQQLSQIASSQVTLLITLISIALLLHAS